MYNKGQIVMAKVTNIVPFGAFCELNGAAGLIHISEFSDYFVKDIRDFVHIGDEVSVEVLDFNPEKKQVKLSFKSCRPELLKKEEQKIKESGMGFKPLHEQILSANSDE